MANLDEDTRAKRIGSARTIKVIGDNRRRGRNDDDGLGLSDVTGFGHIQVDDEEEDDEAALSVAMAKASAHQGLQWMKTKIAMAVAQIRSFGSLGFGVSVATDASSADVEDDGTLSSRG